MNPWMSEQLAQAHIAELHRAAAAYTALSAYRRLPARADRARPLHWWSARRLAAAVHLTALRRPAVVGCQA